jgi:hypothetical protein
LWTFFDKTVVPRYYPTFLIDRPGSGAKAVVLLPTAATIEAGMQAAP